LGDRRWVVSNWFWFWLYFNGLLFGDFIRIEGEGRMHIVYGRDVLIMAISGWDAHWFSFLVNQVKWVFEGDFWIK